MVVGEKELMDSQDYLELHLAIQKLRRPPGEVGKPGARPAIEILLEMLEAEQLPDERLQTVNLLVHEYGYEFDLVGKEWALREAIRLEPDHPYPCAALAMFLWFNCTDMTEAVVMVRQAVKLSEKTGVFQVHSLNVQARIARKAKDWELFASSLSRLMEGSGRRGGPDIGYERDFMRRLPRSAPDKALYKKYNQFVGMGEALRVEENVHKPPT